MKEKASPELGSNQLLETLFFYDTTKLFLIFP